MKAYLSNRTYDALKFVTQILLPAIGTLYFTIAQIWGLPNAEQVVGTIVAVDTFLGLLLGLSSNQYNKSEDRYVGDMVIVETEDKDTLHLELNEHNMDFTGRDELVFKVVRR